MTAWCATKHRALFDSAVEVVVGRPEALPLFGIWWVLRECPNVVDIRMACVGGGFGSSSFEKPVLHHLKRLSVVEEHEPYPMPMEVNALNNNCATSSIVLRAPNLETFRTDQVPGLTINFALPFSSTAMIIDRPGSNEMWSIAEDVMQSPVDCLTFIVRMIGPTSQGQETTAVSRFLTTQFGLVRNLLTPRPLRLVLNDFLEHAQGWGAQLVSLNLSTHGAARTKRMHEGISIRGLEFFARRFPMLQQLSVYVSDVSVNGAPNHTFQHLRRLNVGNYAFEARRIDRVAAYLRGITVVRPLRLGMSCAEAVDEGLLNADEAILTGSWAGVAERLLNQTEAGAASL